MVSLSYVVVNLFGYHPHALLADMLSVLKSLIADKQGYYQNARAEEADPGKYIYTNMHHALRN